MYWSSAFLLMCPNRFSSVLTCRGDRVGRTGRRVSQRLVVLGEGEKEGGRTEERGERREKRGSGRESGRQGVMPVDKRV
jgi:hypothetical protein